MSGKDIPMIEGIEMLKVGSKAPLFEIKDLKGNAFNISQHLGQKQFLLVFWSIFCEPCRYEMPLIQTMHKKYGNKDLEVLAVAIDGDPLKNAIAGFVKQEGFSFRVLIDELDENEYFKVADPYGVAGTPTIYIVDKSGKIAFSKVGSITEKELEKEITNVLKGSVKQ
jgi:peroxiredoxin